jgi:retron-type reverse transcriptase
VNQSKLIEVLSRTIKDGRVISLIHKYLRAGVIVRNSFEETEVGVPQGGPLSPILSNIIIGWVNYFKIADIKTLLSGTDEWMRRRIRMIYWKQWKRVRTKFKMLKSLGIRVQKAWEYANTRKSYWRTSNSPILSKSLTNKVISGFGFFSEYYRQVTA